MFMVFAQRFADSFLRTGFFDPRRNAANQKIDLRQLVERKIRPRKVCSFAV